MVERADAARAQAIAEFATRLRELRASVGTPSFRELAGRSRAISHTTLHEAAQGHRLPSWSTTVEFVKACGADPADYREQWRRADDAVRACAAPSHDAGSAGDLDPTPDAPPAVDVVPPATDRGTPEAPVPAATRPSRRRRTLVLAATGVGVVAAAAVGVVVLTASGGDDDLRAPAAVGSPVTAADCPVQQTNPPPVEPATAGDRAAFITDVTLPDCSRLAPGSTVVKTWRFKNVGTVPWAGYSLHRVDLPDQRDQCQTITDVPIADTPPGGIVDISTAVTAPRQAGFCFVRFKFEDAQGRIAFPAARPVYFQVVVG